MKFTRWVFTTILIVFYSYLLVEATTSQALYFWHFVVIFSAILASLVGLVWHYDFDLSVKEHAKKKILDITEYSANTMEKRKRTNLDAVLRDLSDDDLVRLRQRLQDGTVNDEVLYDNLVGDDGELLTQESYR